MEKSVATRAVVNVSLTILYNIKANKTRSKYSTNECKQQPGIKERMARHCLNRMKAKIAEDLQC